MMRSNPGDDESVTVSFRCYGKHARMVHDAAAGEGASVQQWLRRVVLREAAEALGQPVPHPEEANSAGALIVEAARMSNISPSEFVQQAAAKVAADMIAAQGRGPQKRPSGFVPRGPAKTAVGHR